MMEFDDIVVKENPGLCRCCLSEGCYKDLGSEYTWMNENEVYADMLLECFDISISQINEGPNGPNRLICEVCITRLRDACNFKKQVFECEKKFIDMVARGEFRKVLIYQAHMKSEEVGPEDEIQADESEYLEEDPDFGDDEPLKREEPQPTVSAEPLQIKGKRGRPKKQPDAKPEKKKSNTDDKKTKPVAKGRSRNFDKESASIVDAELVEAKKSWRVLATVLENSTAMPFKRHGNWHKCFFCGKRFQSVLHLRAHNTEQHSAESTNELKELITDPFINLDITSLRCRLCDAAADSLGDFIYHIREKHELNQITFVPRNILCFKLTDTDFSCLNCGRKFKLFGTLLSHIITEHNRLASSNEIIPYKNELDDSLHIRKHECTFCRKRFLSRRRKELHVRLVHESKTNCPYCAETFRSTKDKDGHIYTVHSDEISWQSCDKCPAKFRLHEQLHKHTRRVHLKEKNVTCEVCGMRFFNNGILNMHKVRHSDAKPFQCSICHKHFARKAAMKLHMRIHTNERRYICKLCGKAFVQWSSLQLHLPRHSDERKFRCMVCSKAFKTKNNLKKHSSNVHGKDKVA